ncbi:PH domain-containing protein [Neobacillus sp. K501]
MRFYSKKGIFIGILLWGSILFMGYSTIFLPDKDDGWVGRIIAIIVFLMVTSFFSWLWFWTYYEIDGEDLKIVAGPFKQNVNIMNIKRIKSTNNPLSSPALSLKRIKLEYGKWDFAIISPKDEVSFCNKLNEINPAIVVDLKKKNG